MKRLKIKLLTYNRLFQPYQIGPLRFNLRNPPGGCETQGALSLELVRCYRSGSETEDWGPPVRRTLGP
jgi:hypothetical protein